MIFTAYTLVDITETGARKNSEDHFKVNQQQNNNTLVQLISLRAQPLNIVTEKLEKQQLSNFSFGTHVTKRKTVTVWKMTFTTDAQDAWKYANDDKYHLMLDCHQVAIITNLDETADIKTPMFDTDSDKYKNLYFIANE